jgi:antitoxin (DNA-binding transcriptional repressor) of toxin-antitoxin stability system
MTIELDSKNLTTTAMADALDRVRHGEEVTIADHGQPIARIVPVTGRGNGRVFGEFAGKVHLSDDFTAPLSETELAEWEG